MKRIFVDGFHKSAGIICDRNGICTQIRPCTTWLFMRRHFQHCRRESIFMLSKGLTVVKIENTTIVCKEFLWTRLTSSRKKVLPQQRRHRWQRSLQQWRKSDPKRSWYLRRLRRLQTKPVWLTSISSSFVLCVLKSHIINHNARLIRVTYENKLRCNARKTWKTRQQNHRKILSNTRLPRRIKDDRKCPQNQRAGKARIYAYAINKEKDKTLEAELVRRTTSATNCSHGAPLESDRLASLQEPNSDITSEYPSSDDGLNIEKNSFERETKFFSFSAMAHEAEHTIGITCKNQIPDSFRFATSADPKTILKSVLLPSRRNLL